LIVSLALATGIGPDVWARQDYRMVVTALDILDKRKNTDDQGRQMSG
jgi:hypothetical protein